MVASVARWGGARGVRLCRAPHVRHGALWRDRALLWAGRSSDRASAPPGPGGRAGSSPREDPVDLRAPHRSHQARQDGDPGRVRPQGIPGGEPARAHHRLPGDRGQSERRGAGPALVDAAPSALRPGPGPLRGRPRLLRARQSRRADRSRRARRGGAPTGRGQDHRPDGGRGAAFKRGQRFRAGIEGRISVLRRGRGMRRCRLEGRDRFEIFVGAVVLVNNLLRIARPMPKHPSKGLP